ncbi:MAG: glycosyltransferase family 39 protein [Bacteroidota bacterium]
MFLLRFIQARPLAAILTLAALLRLLAVVAVGDRALVYEFEVLTRNLLDERGFAYLSETQEGTLVEAYVEDPARVFPSAYMPPAYPYFLWAVTSWVGIGTGGILVVTMLQVVLSVVSCALLYVLGVRLFDRRAALWAALGFALFPLLILTPSQISAGSNFIALLLLFLWLLTRVAVRATEEKEEARGRVLLQYALAGAALGLVVLSRSQLIAFVPVVWAWLALLRSPRWLPGAAVLTVACVLVLTPWTLRNAEALGVATPLATSGGHNLWQAYGSQAVGTHASYAVPPRPLPIDLDLALASVPRTDRLEIARDSVYRAFALDALQGDPERAARLGVRKLWLYWVHFGGDDINYPGADSPLFWGPWLLLLPLAFFGIVRAARSDWRRSSFLYLYLLGQTAIVVAFFVLPRYRLAILPVLLLFAGVALAYVQQRVSGRAAGPSPPIASRP